MLPAAGLGLVNFPVNKVNRLPPARSWFGLS
jgi:hypothetical protein